MGFKSLEGGSVAVATAEIRGSMVSASGEQAVDVTERQSWQWSVARFAQSEAIRPQCDNEDNVSGAHEDGVGE